MNKLRIKNTLVKGLVFLTHFIISIIFLLLGWFVVGWSIGFGLELSFVEQIAVPMGIVIMLMSFVTLFKKSFKLYLSIFIVTLSAIIAWTIGVAAMDMRWVLIGYILIMTPVLRSVWKKVQNA
jgi:hypothetical protein